MSQRTLILTACVITGLAATLFLVQYVGGFGSASVWRGVQPTQIISDCQAACRQSCWGAGGDAKECAIDCETFCNETP